MPSAELPKAAKRLSNSDLENSFFRAWALRGSEGSTTTERSQAASFASQSSPSISPRAQVPDRKAKGAERRKCFSDSNILPTSPPLRGPIAPYYEPSYSPPVVMYEEPLLPRTRASTASDSSNEISSSRSSISTRKRKVFGIPQTRFLPKSTKDRQSPFEARKEYKWKHETSGHWLEVQIGKKQATETSQAYPNGLKPVVRAHTSEEIAQHEARNGLPAVKSSSPSSSRPLAYAYSDLQSLPDATLQDSSTGPLLSLQDPKEGLYCRTKRALGLKHGPTTVSRDERDVLERSTTGEVGEALNKVSSALRQFAMKGRESTNLSTSTSTSNLSIAAPSAIAHWQRLQSGSLSSSRSSSSSLRSLMRGHRPPPTPEPGSMYTGSDKQQYLSVDLTDPYAPTFLPSEARRIQTPPLNTAPSGSRKLRGYFSEYNATDDGDTPLSMSSYSIRPVSTRNESNSGSTARLLPTIAGDINDPMSSSKTALGTEWYRAKINAIGADEALTREQFVLSVPEHLPSSPMCPKHPKNKSKGKGVCVYHGRNLSWSSRSASARPNDAPSNDTGSEGSE